MRPPRRLARLAAAVGVLGILAAACADPEPTTSGDPASGSAAEVANVVKPVTGPPKKGGTLIVGLDAESEGFDPTASRMAAAALTISRAIFDPLVVIDKDLKPKPYLAESLTTPNNGRTWDLKVRPNIKFHDGTPLDSAAVKRFLDDYRTSGTVGTAARPIQTIEVVDPLTIRLQMDQEWATFPFFLTVQPGIVAAPSQLDDPSGARKPIGTGPFKFVSWETGKQLIVEKNQDYWRKDAIHLDRIDFRPIADNQTRYSALKAGSIDVMITPREPTIQDLAKDGQAGTFQFVRARGDNDVNNLMLNVSKAPFDDLRLRQAIAHAMDRNQLLGLYNSPPELAADSVFMRTSPWYVDPNYPKYDLEKAKSLVSQIEAEKGPITLKLLTVPDQDVEKNVAVIQQLLQQAGIEMTIEKMEQAQLISRAISGDYEFMTWRQFGNPDPDGNYTWWVSTYAEGGVALNMARNKDPEVDAALIQGRSSSDPAVRKQAYAKIQARHAQTLPYIWTTHLRWTMGAANKVRNIEGGTLPDGTKTAGLISGIMPLNEMWIE